jgi:outer membrane lipoprotein-sorting protein
MWRTMNPWRSRPALRWLVPALAVALVLGGGAAASAITQDDPHLPARTPEQLLVDVQTAQVDSFSGTLVLTSELGLPPLPETEGEGGTDFGSLWSGSNTLRIWYDGPERIRLALLGTLGQADFIRNGQDVWLWKSEANAATHRRLPEGVLTEPREEAPFHGSELTPQQLADKALAAVDPSTEVTTDDPVRVAERPAYQLVLTPRDGASLVREVRIAIDAEQNIPLRVQVFGDSAEPALEARFTQISFETPAAEQFRFNPPPGATVTEEELTPSLPFGLSQWTPQDVQVVGEGWTSVLVVTLGQRPELPLDRLSTELFSALLTDDGRLLIGAVTPERLAEVAAD